MIEALVVEDNPVNQMITTAMLRALGVQSVVAGGVEEARQMLDKGSYQLVLMDSQLPDGDGLHLTAEYVASGGVIPVVSMTGARDPADHRERCLAVGMVAYLEKPFTLKQLKAVVKKHALKG